MSLNFCANLKIDKSVYQKIPPKHIEGYPDAVIEEYKKFLEIPKIKQISEGDTIELKASGYCGKGFALKVNFICGSNPEKTIKDAGVYNSKNEANIKSIDLVEQTCQFLCEKYDLKYNSMSGRKNPIRVLIDSIKSGKID